MPRAILSLLPLFAALPGPAQEPSAPDPPPIRALLVAGGCSHDYATRREILVRGLRERVARPIEWTVRLQGEGEGDARIPLFESSEWAAGHDIVVHDHCFPRVADSAYIDRVLAPHQAGTPAVLLHGTMMSFRDSGTWHDFTGLAIRSHERERSVLVEPLAASHPILKGFVPWTIPREELYRVEKASPGLTVLADAADPSGARHAVVWTRRHGPAQSRVFGSTLGNATATFADPVHLDLVARGFLWALGGLEEGSFVAAPPEESLKGFSLPPPPEALLRPGPNAALRGAASAFSWEKESDPAEAALAVDGDPATAWTSPGPGPGSWRVEFAEAATLGAAVVLWQDPVPEEALLEASADGRVWTPLATLRAGDAARPALVRFAPVPAVRQLRLSVPRTAPGQGFAIREVAAYVSESKIPSALLSAARVADPGEPRLCAAGAEGFPSRVRLAGGWKIAAHALLPGPGEVGQIVPTAEGGAFVSVFPPRGDESGAKGVVHRLSPAAGGGFERVQFFGGFAPETQVAWDGEWLHTLSGAKLDRVRRALGPGPADERGRGGSVYALPETEAPREFALSRLHLGDDGWLHAEASAGTEGMVLDAGGRGVRVPRFGIARFRRDGSGLQILPTKREEASTALDFAEVEGLLASESDGDRVWIAASSQDGLHLACLAREEDAFSPGPVWDDLSATAPLGRLLPTERPSVRREAALEILRRKRDPRPDLESLLASAASPELAGALVAAVSGLGGDASLDWLLRLADSPSAEVKAAAFLALGDHPGAVGHPVFAELGRSTEPAVSAAIFDALRRSGTDLPGAEALAVALARHPDPGLAKAARDFLLARESVEAAFAALDDANRRVDWPVAFALLLEWRRSDTVEGLVARVRATGDPAMRRSLLETLCRLRHDGTDQRRPWEGTARIEGFLKDAFTDRRVDRVALLEAMIATGAPLPDAATLARFAREDTSLEVFAIDALAGAAESPPEEARQWLRLVSTDTSRDDELRAKAAAILSPAVAAKTETALPEARASELPFAELSQASPDAASPARGRRLFHALSCGTCHNLDGEGPAFGPDLTGSPPPEGLVEAILAPGRGSAPEFEPALFEDAVGRRIEGFVESGGGGGGGVLRLVDFAGNHFEEEAADWSRLPPGPPRPRPCAMAGDLPRGEFLDLLAYLRSLESPAPERP